MRRRTLSEILPLGWLRAMVLSALGHPCRSALMLALGIGAPALVALSALVGVRWYPTGDFAHTELMMRAIPRHLPLIGVAARVGNDLTDQGSTAGPSMAYLLFPTYVLFLRSSFGLVVSVIMAHLGAIAAALWVSWKVGGWRAAWAVGVSATVVVRSLAPDFFVEPWNVWVPLLAFGLFVLLVWGTILGHHWMLFWATIVGTHCLQTHISYLPLVLGLLVPSATIVMWQSWRNELAGVRRFSPLIGSLVIGGVLWTLPILEQIRPGPGNLGRLWRHFSDPTEPTVGLRAALRSLVGELNVVGPFVTGRRYSPYDSPHLVGFGIFAVLVALGVVAGSIIARRTSDRRIITLQLVLCASTIGALLSASRIFGYFYEYLIRWMWVLGWLWLAVSCWALVALIGTVHIRRLTVEMLTGCALLVVLAGMGRSLGAEAPLDKDSRIVGGLAAQLESSIDRSKTYLLRWHDPASLGGTGFGLLLEMEKRGVDLYVDAWAGAAAQQYRVRTPTDTDVVLCMVTGVENLEVFRHRQDIIELAIFDPRSSAEIVRSSELRREIEEFLRASGRLDTLERLDSQYGHTQVLMAETSASPLTDSVKEYNDIRLPVGLFEAPQGALCIP